MSSIDPITLRAFQATGITTSAMLAGMTLGFTTVSVPMMQVPGVTPTIAARQWLELYNLGKPFAVGCTVISVLSNSYALYRAHYSWPAEIAAPSKELLLGAIIAQASFVVYTALFMESGINARLSVIGREAQAGGLSAKIDETKISSEIKTWVAFHNVRVGMPAVAAVLGLLSILF